MQTKCDKCSEETAQMEHTLLGNGVTWTEMLCRYCGYVWATMQDVPKELHQKVGDIHDTNL